MERSYKVLYQGGEGEVVEKKSRFLAAAIPVRSEEAAKEELEAIRKKHWDASHHCYAYVTGEGGREQKCGDDGEPSGTAGRPMLEVLLGEGVRDALLVVTRYFGGTLLGTGGLVKAYTKAAQEGLAHGVILEKRLARKVGIRMEYTGVGKLKYVAGRMDVSILDETYAERATFELLVPVGVVEGFREELMEATSARLDWEDAGTLWFGKLKGELIVWEGE